MVKEKTILQIELLKQLSQGQGGNGGLTGSQLALFAVLNWFFCYDLLNISYGDWTLMCVLCTLLYFPFPERTNRFVHFIPWCKIHLTFIISTTHVGFFAQQWELFFIMIPYHDKKLWSTLIFAAIYLIIKDYYKTRLLNILTTIRYIVVVSMQRL